MMASNGHLSAVTDSMTALLERLVSTSRRNQDIDIQVIVNQQLRALRGYVRVAEDRRSLLEVVLDQSNNLSVNVFALKWTSRYQRKSVLLSVGY